MPRFTDAVTVTRDTASDVVLDLTLHGASTFKILADGTVTSPGTTTNTANLALKAPLASPTFTGVPAAPTATALTSTTQLATTAFVSTMGLLKANKAAPVFTATTETGVAVTAGGIHAALVNLGLITA